MKRVSGLLTMFFLACLAAAEEGAPPRVIVVSWDGAPYWMISRLLSQGSLPNLQRFVGEGAWSDGMVTSFPSKAAAARAMLWTGHYGHTNGVTGDAVLLEPASGHSLLESRAGCSSDALKVEPLWTRTARAGLETYIFNVAASHPFEKPAEGVAERTLQMLCSCTGLRLPGVLMDAGHVSAAPAEGWAIPEARSRGARQFRFGVGDGTYWGLFFDDPVDPVVGCDTLGVVRHRSDEVFLARIKPGEWGRFSVPIPVEHEGEDLWFSLRLFELDSSGAGFALYRTSAERVVTSSDDFPGRSQPFPGACAGNGAGALYRRGDLGVPLSAGGDGEAESRFLQILAHATGQLEKQVGPVLRRGDFRLLILSAPAPEEVGEAFAGYLDTNVAGHNEAVAGRLWAKVDQAFERQDGLLGIVMGFASELGAHVVLVSDHGTAGTTRRLNVNVALERVGLLALTANREIDLARTRALLLPLDDGSVAVNTVGRPGGIVPLEQREAVLDEVRRTLEEIRDSENAVRVVSGFFAPSRQGLLQPGGETTGDLWMDLAPGYDLSPATDRDEIISVTIPQGRHGFLPTRRDMLAIFAAWGRRIPAGMRWPRVPAIDVVPTVLDLLDMDPPADLPGTSLVPVRPIIEPVRSSSIPMGTRMIPSSMTPMSGCGAYVSDFGHTLERKKETQPLVLSSQYIK